MNQRISKDIGQGSEKMNKGIFEFRNEYRFLSNFYPLDNGYTIEHLYQASKTNNSEEKQEILNARTPGEAKRLGQCCTKRSDWEKLVTGPDGNMVFTKVKIMYDLVKAKFLLSPKLRKKLLDTNNNLLVEGNNWKDSYWGVDMKTGKGLNRLGEILMRIRRELREE